MVVFTLKNKRNSPLAPNGGILIDSTKTQRTIFKNTKFINHNPNSSP